LNLEKLHQIKEKYNPKNFPPKFEYYLKKYNEEKFGINFKSPDSNNEQKIEIN